MAYKFAYVIFFMSMLFTPYLLGRIYSVGLMILCRIADYFVQNRRFFVPLQRILKNENN